MKPTGAPAFLASVPAGLIALGVQNNNGGASPGTTTFQVVVLASLAFLGVVTFLRCLEISIDDWQFAARITKLRAIYVQLVPQLADILTSVSGVEQMTAMLARRRYPFQMLLSVAGSTGVITSIIIGADVGALLYGLHAPLAVVLVSASAIGVLATYASGPF